LQPAEQAPPALLHASGVVQKIWLPARQQQVFWPVHAALITLLEIDFWIGALVSML
jgi:hypothetical protein